MRLFEPLKIRDLTFRNRIVVSPMCQYSSTDGFATDWHLVHLGSRAVGGASAVITEATAVTAEGRISPEDLGIWKDEHMEQLGRIARFISDQGAIPGMQIAHAGRKASTKQPWVGNGWVPETEGGWKPVAPSAVAFDPSYGQPSELSVNDVHAITKAFTDAATRALRCGFQLIEIHAAHGYLLHEFLSPLSNKRTDAYGGSLENRARFLCETVSAVRKILPERLPLFVRISATDWIPGGWDAEQSVEVAKMVGKLGADLIDCSSGGLDPAQKIPAGPSFQVPFAEKIRKETGLLTGAVGMIEAQTDAEKIIEDGKADLVLFAREFLRTPYLPFDVARKAGVAVPWPVQYLRAAPNGTPPRS
jgi:2,4-dienoyl-CoA reductase-like NADH-dependent reductase (Old Yellow Enzyme family)